MEFVIVGYDGSDGSESALEWTAHRARGGTLQVTILSVTNPFLSDRRQADARLAAAEQRFRTLAPQTPVRATRWDGIATSTLVDEARDASLLVLGVTVKAQSLPLLFSWLPVRVAARSRTPTVLVPSGWTPSSAPVTVGVDDDDSSRAAVLFASREAHTESTALRLVHSWLMAAPGAARHGGAPTTSGEVAAQHQDILTRATELARSAHPDLTLLPELVRDNPTAALSTFAERSSLLVLGTHHRGAAAGRLTGSVGMDLIGYTACVVGVVPPDDVARA